MVKIRCRRCGSFTPLSGVDALRDPIIECLGCRQRFRASDGEGHPCTEDEARELKEQPLRDVRAKLGALYPDASSQVVSRSQVPTFAVVFDIDALSVPTYGIEAWRLVWHACNPRSAVGATLFEGDSAATLKGLERVYVCAFNGLIHVVKTNVEAELNRTTPQGYLRCDWSDHLAEEPLRQCGVVTETPLGVAIDETGGTGHAAAGLEASMRLPAQDRRRGWQFWRRKGA